MLGTFLDWLSAVGSCWIGAVMLLVCADVVARSAFNKPIDAVAEMAGYAVVGIVFLQLPAAILRNRMTKSDLVLTWLAQHLPRLYLLVESLFTAFSIAIFAVLSKVSWTATELAWRRGESAGVEGILTFPAWPLKALIALGAALSAVALCLQLLRLFRANRSHPTSSEHAID